MIVNFGKSIGTSKIWLLLIFGCAKLGGNSTIQNRIYVEDIAYINVDTLLNNYCFDKFGSYGYNCDSIVNIRRCSQFCECEKVNGNNENRFYTVSFYLEDDYILANVFIYKFDNDSIFLFENSEVELADCQMNLIMARVRFEHSKK